MWEEKFTRGARRRRNSSADMHHHAHVQRHRRVCDDVPGFGAIVSVDEVDIRRGTSSVAHDDDVPTASTSQDDEAGLLPSFSRRLHIGADPHVPIAEEAEDDLFPLPSASASSSPLTLTTERDESSLFSQGADVARSLGLSVPPTDRASGDDDDEEEPRVSVYYTPDTSPTSPPWETSSNTSSPDQSDSPVTPPQTFTRSIPIPHPTHRQGMFFAEDFEFIDAPSTPSEERGDHIPSGASPNDDISTSLGGRKRQFMHLPRRDAILRAGADFWKGVTAIGSSPMPLAV